MTPRRDTFDLLMRHLDGRLSGDDLRALNDILRTDARARDWLREIAAQAVAMGDLARGRRAEPAPGAAPRDVVRLPHWRPLARAAALVLLAFAGAAGWQFLAARPVVTLAEATGAVLWTGGRGGARIAASAGARLRHGPIETVGVMASAQLRFRDGTTITLGGNSEAVVSANGRIHIELKSGTLTASVATQPAGRPMVIRTATAEMEVLGTVFAVEAQPEQTRLNVDEGRVRFRRLVDGRAVDVVARHEAVVSLHAGQPLVAAPPGVLPDAWIADLASAPAGGSKGEPRAADGVRPARWGAVPLIMGRDAGGAPTIHHGICLRGPARSASGSFVTLSADSVVGLRWRASHPSGLFVFLITQRPGGGFGGNFEIKTAPDAGSDDGDGWRRMTLPLRDFRPLHPGRTAFAGHGVSAVLVTTFGADAGLEVAVVDIERGGAAEGVSP